MTRGELILLGISFCLIGMGLICLGYGGWAWIPYSAGYWTFGYSAGRVLAEGERK